jgi:hypothetical protein
MSSNSARVRAESRKSNSEIYSPIDFDWNLEEKNGHEARGKIWFV